MVADWRHIGMTLYLELHTKNWREGSLSATCSWKWAQDYKIVYKKGLCWNNIIAWYSGIWWSPKELWQRKVTTPWGKVRWSWVEIWPLEDSLFPSIDMDVYEAARYASLWFTKESTHATKYRIFFVVMEMYLHMVVNQYARLSPSLYK